MKVKHPKKSKNPENGQIKNFFLLKRLESFVKITVNKTAMGRRTHTLIKGITWRQTTELSQQRHLHIGICSY